MEKFGITSSILAITLTLAIVQVLTINTPLDIPPSVILKQTQPGESTFDNSFPGFDDVTLDVGINFSHHQSSDTLAGIDESLGGGMCLFDYDNDGWVDIFLVEGSGQTRFYGRQAWWARPDGNRLYRNIQGREFINVSEEAGLTDNFRGMGCASADLDNDGDNDLIITAFGRNRLYRNEGNGRFTETGESVFTGEHWSTSVAVADYNGDGLSDIYITNYLQYARGARTFEFNTGFQATMPEAFNAALYNGSANQLYRNLGNLQFEEVADELGIADMAGRGLQPVWLDFNADNQPDLLIVNDTGSPNQMYLNTGKEGFVRSDLAFQVEAPTGHHGATILDFNNDGQQDIALTTPPGYPPSLLLRQLDLQASGVPRYLTEDINWESGLARDNKLSLAGWGVTSADFDNNGIMDLYVNNGLVIPDSNSVHVATGQPNTIFLGKNSAAGFHSETVHSLAMPGRGLAYADFDNDGDIDVYVANNNNDGQLLYNQTNDNPKHHGWVGIELQDKHGNRNGLHAKIRAVTESGVYYRDTYTRQGFLSHAESRLHLGLGEASRVEQLTVTWADGSTSEFENLASGKYYRISQQDNLLTVLDEAETIEAYNATTSDFYPLRTPFQEYLIGYLDVLGEIAQTPAGADLINLDEIQSLFIHGDNPTRIAVLEFLQKFNSREMTGLAYSAIQSEEENLVIAGIDLLQAYESEPAVYRLLTLFDDASDRVLCRLAEAFRFFYQEEEAVIHRKYLAMPALVRMLDHENAQVVRCALAALGEAEEYRGIDAIISRTLHNDVDVRIAAVNALGRIRDGKATDRLHAILADTTSPPRLLADTLTALSRIDDQDMQSHLTGLISIREFAPFPDNIATALLTSDALLHPAADGIVISPERIKVLLTTLLQKANSAHSLSNLKEEDAELTVILSLLTEINTTAAMDLVAGIAQSNDGQVRLKALEALVQQPSNEARAVIETALVNDPEIHDALVDILISNGYSVSAQTFARLESADSTNSLPYYALAPDASAKHVLEALGLALQDTNNTANVMIGLQTCRKFIRQEIVVPDNLYRHAEDSVREAAFRCLVAQNLHGLNDETASNLFWEFIQSKHYEAGLNLLNVVLANRRNWLNDDLLRLFSKTDNSVSSSNRQIDTEFPDGQFLVDALAALDSSTNAQKQFIYVRALSHDAPEVQAKALALFASTMGNLDIQDRVALILTDQKAATPLRMQAATVLARYQPSTVLAQIRK